MAIIRGKHLPDRTVFPETLGGGKAGATLWPRNRAKRKKGLFFLFLVTFLTPQTHTHKLFHLGALTLVLGRLIRLESFLAATSETEKGVKPHIVAMSDPALREMTTDQLHTTAFKTAKAKVPWFSLPCSFL